MPQPVMSANTVVIEIPPVPQAVVPAYTVLTAVEIAMAEMQADIQAVATAMRFMSVVIVTKTTSVVTASTMMISPTVMRTSGERCRHRNKGEDRDGQKPES